MAKSLIFIALVIAEKTYAASEGGHGSVADLFPPAVNFIVLFGTLIFLLRRKMAEHFNNKADNVDKTMNRAKKKAEEVQAQYSAVKSKLDNLDGEYQKILTEAEREAQEYAKKVDAENQARIAKLEKDSEQKVEAERKASFENLSQELVNHVVSVSKTRIKQDQQLKTTMTQNLLKELR